MIVFNLKRDVIVKMDYSLYEDKLILMTFTGKMYKIPFSDSEEHIEEGSFFDYNVWKLEEDEDLIKFEIDFLKIPKPVSFKILDDQTKVLIYSKTDRLLKHERLTPTTFFDKCFIHDLSTRILEKIEFSSTGNFMFDTVGVDYDAQRCVSVMFQEPEDKNDFPFDLRYTWFDREENININKFLILGRYKNQRKNYLLPNKDSMIKSFVTSICFLYKIKATKKDYVVISESNGKLHLFSLNKYPKNQKDFKMVLLDTCESLYEEDDGDEDTVIQNDHIVKIVKCFNHKYLFMLTKFSKIRIYTVNHQTEKLVLTDHSFNSIYRILDMRISGDGSYLFIGGTSFDSLTRFDLNSIDSENFPRKDKVGVLKLAKEFSEFVIKDDDLSIQNILRLLIFESFKKKSKFDEKDLKNIQIKIELKREEEIKMRKDML